MQESMNGLPEEESVDWKCAEAFQLSYSFGWQFLQLSKSVAEHVAVRNISTATAPMTNFPLYFNTIPLYNEYSV
jgi:hypothetical protein